MIREGTFDRRAPRGFKRMTPHKRESVLRENPLVPYRFAVETGMRGVIPNEGRIIAERVKWCRENVSKDNSGWNQRFMPSRQTGELTFLFNDHATAFAFMMRWC